MTTRLRVRSRGCWNDSMRSWRSFVNERSGVVVGDLTLLRRARGAIASALSRLDRVKADALRDEVSCARIDLMRASQDVEDAIRKIPKRSTDAPWLGQMLEAKGLADARKAADLERDAAHDEHER